MAHGAVSGPSFPLFPGPSVAADADDHERLAGRIPVLSIVIPALNEQATIERILRRVIDAPLPCRREIIVVDDGSTDETPNLVRRFVDSGQVRLLRKQSRGGKGAAVRAGIAVATGDFVVIQDADEEYEPRDLATVVLPLVEGRAQAVYGSRVTNQHFNPGVKWLNPFWWGGRSLTLISNLLFPSLHISDEPVCYKAVRMDVLRTIPMRCTGFEFCPELTAKLAKRGVKIWEVPIRYSPRSVKQGKKIRARHWFDAVWWLLFHRFASDAGPIGDFNPGPPEGVVSDSGPVKPLPHDWDPALVPFMERGHDRRKPG